MFICVDECIKQFTNRGIFTSRGPCEICGQTKICYDIKNSHLERVEESTMEDSVQKRFYAFLAEFLREERDLDAVEVTYAKEETQWSGGCETCYFEWTEVNIVYVDSNGVEDTYTFHGSMSELFVL